MKIVSLFLVLYRFLALGNTLLFIFSFFIGRLGFCQISILFASFRFWVVKVRDLGDCLKIPQKDRETFLLCIVFAFMCYEL